MAWYPGAHRQQLLRNFGGTLKPIAVTLHHQAGSGNPYSVYLARGVSAHFWIAKNGQVIQHVDTAARAWHGVAHNSYSIGVETEGCGAPPHAEPLNEAQLREFGKLMAWANRIHGIPLQLSEAVTQAGLNYHRARGGPSTGCPCSVRVNQRGEILKRARGQAGTTQTGGGATATTGKKAPPFPGRLLRQPPIMRGTDVATWQQRMKGRGWNLVADGAYGPVSQKKCRDFQYNQRLVQDGIVGPITWKATWENGPPKVPNPRRG